MGFFSLVGGIYSLFVPLLATTHVAAIFVIFGVSSLYIGFYGSDKARYEQVGKELTQGFLDLQVIYRTIKSLPEDADFSGELQKVLEIRSRMLSISMSKQIFLSDWYAHYKFFWIAQIDWVQESRPFNLWRDKIPLTAYLVIIALIGSACLYGFSGHLPVITQNSPECCAKP